MSLTIVAVIVLILILILILMVKPGAQGEPKPEYTQVKGLLTNAEHSFYKTLVNAKPINSVIFCKVYFRKTSFFSVGIFNSNAIVRTSPSFLNSILCVCGFSSSKITSSSLLFEFSITISSNP